MTKMFGKIYLIIFLDLLGPRLSIALVRSYYKCFRKFSTHSEVSLLIIIIQYMEVANEEVLITSMYYIEHLKACKLYSEHNDNLKNIIIALEELQFCLLHYVTHIHNAIF